MISGLTLRDVPMAERPRERLASYGVGSLSTAELLALVLGRGTSGRPVMMTAQELLARFGSVGGLATASLEDLLAIPGVGLAKACQLQAAAQLAVRWQRELTEPAVRGQSLTDPVKVASLIRQTMHSFDVEQYILVSLDTRNRQIAADCLSVGTLDAALVHPRETFACAIKRHAAKVILAHNHPSGDPHPSDDDLAITKRLVTAGKILGITVLDHVIVTRQGFYSFRQAGEL